MRIGVVSDTHGHVEHTRAAVRMLESLEVEAVLHCGDIGTPEVIELFAPWPTHFVFGNCDHERGKLRQAISAAKQSCHEEFGELTLGETRIALLHSHDERKFETAIHSGKYALVCYGHTHVAKIEQVGETVVLNPGALYRANPHSLAVVELAAGVKPSATIVRL